MSSTQRLLSAAGALSLRLKEKGVPHAFHGSILVSLLSRNPECDEMVCIVESSANAHPFRRVRDAIESSPDFTTIMSPWSNRLHVTYQNFIPAIEIEVLVAGEEGPRRLNSSTIMQVQGIPFLTMSEFLRAKLRTWAIRGHDPDAEDIMYVLTRHWNHIDINRIPEQDMNVFVGRHRAASTAWTSLKRKYGM